MNPFINQNYINQIYLALASLTIIYSLKYGKTVKNPRCNFWYIGNFSS
jgi:hypothetical protein